MPSNRHCIVHKLVFIISTTKVKGGNLLTIYTLGFYRYTINYFFAKKNYKLSEIFL